MSDTSQQRRLIRDAVRGIAPVAHGSVTAAELAAYGLSLDEVIDFSVNTNPLGAHASVLATIGQARWDRYPGDDEIPLRQRLADANGVQPTQVVLGNGSSELLWLLALAVLEPGQRAAVLAPTFGEYARAAMVAGADVIEVTRTEELPAETGLVFLCNPNNPTGSYLDACAVERLLAAAPGRLLVLDEAYASFAPVRWPMELLLRRYENVVIVRSMTKDHALPGLRLGYLLAPSELAASLELVRPPWSVNAGALRAGLCALEPAALAHVARARKLVAESRELLTSGFRRLGFEVQPSHANFVLVEVGDGAAFRRALLGRGLVVRDCASFGLPGHVRVACLLPDQCQRLLNAVAEYSNGTR